MSGPTKRLRTILSLVILASFAVWVIVYISRHAEEFTVITQVPLYSVASLYLVFLLILVFTGLYTRDILSVFGLKLELKEWFSLVTASSLANYMSPFRGGVGFRAVYLKALYRFPFTDFLSTLSAMYVMFMGIHGMLGILGLVILETEGKDYSMPIAVMFVSLVLAFIIVFSINFTINDTGKFPVRHVSRILNGLALLRRARRILLRLFFYILIIAILTVVQTRLAFDAYDLTLSWGATLFYVGGRNISALMSITPGALGIVEWMCVYMGGALDYTTSQAILVQGLVRLVAVSTLIVIGPLAILYLSHNKTRFAPSLVDFEQRALDR